MCSGLSQFTYCSTMDLILVLCRSDSRPPNHGDPAPSLTVELSTCSQCSHCEALLYDEQIMSGWSGDEANYKTTCPYCSSQMVASLTVTTKQVGVEGGRGVRGMGGVGTMCFYWSSQMMASLTMATKQGGGGGHEDSGWSGDHVSPAAPASLTVTTKQVGVTGGRVMRGVDGVGTTSVVVF